MAIRVFRAKADRTIKKIITALERYQAAHPDAEMDVYRQNPVSIRIRVIDRVVRGQDASQRQAAFWTHLEDLPEDTRGDISMLVLLTPEERQTSFANMEFEDPVPSTLP
jgi:hypothetical protein